MHRSRSPPRHRSRSYSRSPRRKRHRSRSPPHYRSRSPRREYRSRSRSHSPPRRHRPSHSSPFLQTRHETPSLGSMHKARIVSIRPFGVFLRLPPPFNIDGMCHVSAVSEDLPPFSRDDDESAKIQALEYYAGRHGDQVWVKVIDVREEDGPKSNNKVGLSMRAVDQSSGRDLDPNNTLILEAQNYRKERGGRGEDGRAPLLPELFSIQQGKVQTVKPFGCFVQLDGYRGKSALVHVSQISDHLHFSKEDGEQERISAIQQVVTVGERAWVKIVEVDPATGKIGASMKHVSQSTGEDLDPQNLRYKARSERGGVAGSNDPHQLIGQVGRQGKSAGVVEWGHLKADVVNYGGVAEGAYEILGGSEGEDIEKMDDGKYHPDPMRMVAQPPSR